MHASGDGQADLERLTLRRRRVIATIKPPSEFVETYLQLVGPEEVEFEEVLGSDDKYAKVEQMITSYEKQGLQKGKQEALILLAEKRFGKLSAGVKRKIRAIASTETLESPLLAVLDAKSLEELPL